MNEHRVTSIPPPRADATTASPRTGGDTSPAAALRQHGGRAHQLRAAVRAADRFIARGEAHDHETSSWLMSSAVGLSAELATDLDALARALKEPQRDGGVADGALHLQVGRLRVRAHQLHAASRAADHFLEQENHDDQNTGSWLIACALGLADKLVDDIDDRPAPAPRRAMPADLVVDVQDAGPAQRVGIAVAALRPARNAA